MGPTLILIVMVIYFVIAIDFLIKKEFGLGITYLSYAASNIGLYMVAKSAGNH